MLNQNKITSIFPSFMVVIRLRWNLALVLAGWTPLDDDLDSDEDLNSS